ncbi:VOC family protein [Domibacillus iocasae]|uniref:PhnB-like domain-containing protein n=1 Tax=Domibacillus iocasae TaxID=1714016 RepID=A0A1E7DSI8_9BACI|nr:VOC family protein [Domibacillus iocasae]OES45989.1 hypothetical protein BA724_16620 [Domibacillus iocasae]
MQKVTAFLMFKGNAEQAMDLYTSSFDNSEKINVLHNQDGTVLPTTDTHVCVKYYWVDDKFGVSWQLNLLKNK